MKALLYVAVWEGFMLVLLVSLS